MSSRLITLGTATILLIPGSCSQDDPEPGVGALGVEALGVEAVEDLTEAVANRLIELSDAVRRRDFDRASTYLSAGFRGRGFRIDGSWDDREDSLPLGVARSHRSVTASAPWIDRSGFVADLESLMSAFESIDRVHVKTVGAEFPSTRDRGDLKLTTEIIGRTAGNSMRTVHGQSDGKVVLRGGEWVLQEFGLLRYRITTRARPVFTDVASPAGMAHRDVRLGAPGNESFYWRGAACADVDGDGRYDVFSSASDRNFLYVNTGNGRFDERAAAAGLSRPVGPTCPLFFDYDNDGDKDLFMAFVGWEDDGAPGGRSLHLFANDGKGRFVDVSDQTGLSRIRASAFTTIASDFDGDGWLDLYVCAYGRLDAVYPDSWHAAKNGRPNLLLRNRKGEGFVEEAAMRGVAGTAWSYAAAAADYDADGDQDLYVANDYGTNNLYRNEGGGRFVDVAQKAGVLDTGNGMGAAWGDLDNDGDLDLYVCNMSSSAGRRILGRVARRDAGGIEGTLYKLAAGNSIFEWNGDSFSRLSPDAGGIGASWAWGASLFDVDLDGRLDIYVANGFISGDSLKDT